VLARRGLRPGRRDGRKQFPSTPGGGAEGDGEGRSSAPNPERPIQLPVLHLDDQQSPAGMKQEEIRMHALRSDRDVVPTEPVVLEVRLQPLREAPLPARHPAGDARQRGNELRSPQAGARVVATRKVESDSHDNSSPGSVEADVSLLAPSQVYRASTK